MTSLTSVESTPDIPQVGIPRSDIGTSRNDFQCHVENSSHVRVDIRFLKNCHLKWRDTMTMSEWGITLREIAERASTSDIVDATCDPPYKRLQMRNATAYFFHLAFPGMEFVLVQRIVLDDEDDKDNDDNKKMGPLAQAALSAIIQSAIRFLVDHGGNFFILRPGLRVFDGVAATTAVASQIVFVDPRSQEPNAVLRNAFRYGERIDVIIVDPNRTMFDIKVLTASQFPSALLQRETTVAACIEKPTPGLSPAAFKVYSDAIECENIVAEDLHTTPAFSTDVSVASEFIGKGRRALVKIHGGTEVESGAIFSMKTSHKTTISSPVANRLQRKSIKRHATTVDASTSLPKMDIDVKAIRDKLNLTQEAFARTFGLTVSSVRNWEQRARVPESPVALYLHLVDRFPEQVKKEVAMFRKDKDGAS